jgi:hypothetical protein
MLQSLQSGEHLVLRVEKLLKRHASDIRPVSRLSHASDRRLWARIAWKIAVAMEGRMAHPR